MSLSSKFDLTIITPTYNNEKQIRELLESIKKQTFPKDKLELLIVDGGSTDNTLKIVSEYNTRVVHNPHRLAEPGVNIGMNEAQGELMMVLAVDNIYDDPKAIQTIVDIFKNKDIYGAFPKHDSTSSDSIFTKYHNNFTDPFNHFINGDASNGRTFHRIYPTVEHNDIFDVYDFSKNKIKPMIAFAQGFTIRRDYRRSEFNAFDDCRPIIELIEDNKKIAFVHSISIYHHTTRDMDHFIRKQRWATENALERQKYGIAHRVDKLTPGQKLRIAIWPVYAFSIILPIIYSIYGAVRDKQLIWLFHPIGVWLTAYAMVIQMIVHSLKKSNIISRQ